MDFDREVKCCLLKIFAVRISEFRYYLSVFYICNVSLRVKSEKSKFKRVGTI